jgi:hypothetical protein
MKNEGALRMRFLRHDGIYRSDVSSLLFTPGACPAFRSGRCQGIGRAGRNTPCPSSAMSSGRLFLDGLLASIAAESARGISPRAAHRSGLDTLASSGSCHRTKAAASRRELELLLLPVGSLPTSVTCPLRSTGITPLPRYYGAVRPYPPHRYFRPRSFAACTFSLGIAGQVLKFRTRARTRVMPPIHRAPRGQ